MRLYKYSILLYATLLTVTSQQLKFNPDEDSRLSLSRIIRKYGYPLQDHFVTTKDGFILHLFRIPHGRYSQTVNSKPVLIMHGLQGSADNFVLMGPEESLAYHLAEEGYDVWMGNSRGNIHSRNHTYLDPDNDPRFWEFSWHEIGTIDIPTEIDYILKKTNSKRLHYIGHSQGTTSLLVLLSELPSYNRKVIVPILLAPSAFQKYMPNPIGRLAARIQTTLSILAKSIQLYEIIPHLPQFQKLLHGLCMKNRKTLDTCIEILYHIGGENEKQFDRNKVTFIMSKVPGGSSVMQFFHYAQLIKSGKFRQYDYGDKANLMKYGQYEPPDYNLKNITVPVAIFFGNNDLLVSKRDVKTLTEALPNIEKLHLVEDKAFSHMDFIWANDVMKLVYTHVVAIMKKYDKYYR